MHASDISHRRLSRRRILALAAAAGAAALGGRLPARGTASVEKQTLANGLTVLVQERPSADTIALLYTTLAGVRDDGNAPGSTVLTSRMLLQGSPRYPSLIARQRAATLAGGTIARGSTSEYSNISSVMPADAAETAFDLVSDAVTNPLFAPDAFSGQKKVALQDLAQRHSTPSILIGDLYQQTIFAGQPLGQPPLGTADSIAAMTLDTLQANRARLWGASNTLVTVVGRIATADAFDLANRYFGALPAGTQNVRQPTQVQPPSSPQLVQATAGQQVQLRIGFTSPSLAEPDRYPLAVLTGMMSGFSGRLLRSLRSELGLVFTPSATYSTFSDAGTWFASVAMDPSNLDQAMSVTRDELERIRNERADSGEVADAIEAIAGEAILASESNASVASQLAAQQILGDVSTEEFVRRVQPVSPDDVQRVAQTYLDLNHSLTALVGPAQS